MPDDCDSYTTPIGRTHWFWLWIDNHLDASRPTEVEVVAYRVFKVVDSRLEKVRSFVQSSLIWTHDTEEHAKVIINPKMGRHCDLGFVARDYLGESAVAELTDSDESRRPFILHTRTRPTNRFNELLPGAYKIELAVISSSQTDFYTLDLSWTGRWNDDVKQIVDHELKMRLRSGKAAP